MIIFCDFEFMDCDIETNKIITRRGNKSKKTMKGKTEKIPFVMSYCNFNDQVEIQVFVPINCNLYTAQVRESMWNNMKEHRDKILKDTDYVIVWDKKNDSLFLNDIPPIIDLREIFRHLGILRHQTFVPQTEQSGECGLKGVAKRLLNREILDIDSQKGDWSNPTDEMLEYAKNDVILLRDLTIYAMQLKGCNNFMELNELANKYNKIHLSNDNKLKNVQKNAILSKIRYMTNDDLLKKGTEKDQVMKKLDKIISNDFKNFDRSQLYIPMELNITYTIIGTEIEKGEEIESIYIGEFRMDQII